jgi:hypothetical protein
MTLRTRNNYFLVLVGIVNAEDIRQKIKDKRHASTGPADQLVRHIIFALISASKKYCMFMKN